MSAVRPMLPVAFSPESACYGAANRTVVDTYVANGRSCVNDRLNPTLCGRSANYHKAMAYCCHSYAAGVDCSTRRFGSCAKSWPISATESIGYATRERLCAGDFHNPIMTTQRYFAGTRAGSIFLSLIRKISADGRVEEGHGSEFLDQFLPEQQRKQAVSRGRRRQIEVDIDGHGVDQVKNPAASGGDS